MLTRHSLADTPSTAAIGVLAWAMRTCHHVTGSSKSGRVTHVRNVNGAVAARLHLLRRHRHRQRGARWRHRDRDMGPSCPGGEENVLAQYDEELVRLACDGSRESQREVNPAI